MRVKRAKHVIHVHIGAPLYERLRGAADANCVTLIHEIRRRLSDSFHYIDDATLSVPEAGSKYFGLSRNGSYNAAARGDIPTIRIGKKIRVPVFQVEQLIKGRG